MMHDHVPLKMNVKINDPYPAFKPSFDPKELYPDAEVVKDLSELTFKILRQADAEMETWLRRVSVPLLEEGYRLPELTLILSSDRFWKKGKPLRILMPGKDVNPLLLMVRRQWRRWFPYRLPNGNVFNKLVKEKVNLK